MDGENHLQMGDVGDVGMLACWPRHSPTPKYSHCVMVNPNFKLATYHTLFLLFPSMSRYSNPFRLDNHSYVIGPFCCPQGLGKGLVQPDTRDAFRAHPESGECAPGADRLGQELR